MTLSGFAYVAGCSEGAQSHFQKAPAPAASAASTVTPPLDTDEYRVEFKPISRCLARKECEVELLLEAKGNFHVNMQYPTKFEAFVTTAKDIIFIKPVMAHKDGRSEENKFSLPVAFAGANPGTATIGGKFSFSVCNDTTCVIESTDVETAVKVE